jgi:hypothetical protein
MGAVMGKDQLGIDWFKIVCIVFSLY